MSGPEPFGYDFGANDASAFAQMIRTGTGWDIISIDPTKQETAEIVKRMIMEALPASYSSTAAEVALKQAWANARIETLRGRIERELHKLQRSLLTWPGMPSPTLPIYRPQQRSANMRKHARIVRSRMTTNDRRRKGADWARLKRHVARGIHIPPTIDIRKDI